MPTALPLSLSSFMQPQPISQADVHDNPNENNDDSITLNK